MNFTNLDTIHQKKVIFQDPKFEISIPITIPPTPTEPNPKYIKEKDAPPIQLTKTPVQKLASLSKAEQTPTTRKSGKRSFDESKLHSENENLVSDQANSFII